MESYTYLKKIIGLYDEDRPITAGILYDMCHTAEKEAESFEKEPAFHVGLFKTGEIVKSTGTRETYVIVDDDKYHEPGGKVFSGTVIFGGTESTPNGTYSKSWNYHSFERVPVTVKIIDHAG